jgi:acylphosphatase
VAVAFALSLLIATSCPRAEETVGENGQRDAQPGSASQPTTQPTTRPAVDVEEQEVVLPAVAAKQGTHAVLGGAIEYVLVSEGGKEYETLFATPCTPEEIDEALRKVGLRPGEPASRDQPPRGPKVQVFVELRADGQAVRQPVEQFLAHLKGDKPVRVEPWIYTGSGEAIDPATRKTVLRAALTKSLIGLHPTDTTPLIQNPREEARKENTYKANAEALPPPGTSVRIVVRRVPPEVPEGTRRVHAFLRGRVQGVGFRNFTQRAARMLRLAGWVRNLRDGRVEMVAEGPAEKVAKLLEQVRVGPRASRVEGVEITDEPPQGEAGGFEVRR